MDLNKQFNPQHWSKELQLIYFLSDSGNGYKVGSDRYSESSSPIF